MVAAGAACTWAALRAARQDRPLVTAAGALAAALLGLAVALAMSQHRMRRELRVRTEALRAESARTAAAYADAARQMSGELEAARRSAREAQAQRRAAAAAGVSLRAALKAETARSAALAGETARLAEVTVPTAVDRLRSGGSADAVLAGLPQPSEPAHQRLLDVLVREIGAGERMRAAATAACASAAGRVQALTTGMLADLREMEDRHGEEVLGDLLRLDHCAAQTGRLADSIAVLTGARSGRRWTKPIVMESVLRGAMGRISAYRRVRLHSASTAAVAGHAAEGVMHALAELMDNACNFSPPSQDVHVYVQETGSGVVVTVEDAGPVMPDATLLRAERLVSAEPLDPRSLPGTRLGLAVVGCLARKHGLLVSFRPSSRGGTGVVVLIPAKLLTRVQDDLAVPEAAGRPPRRTDGARTRGVPPEADRSAPVPAPGSGAGDGNGSASAPDSASAPGSWTSRAAGGAGGAAAAFTPGHAPLSTPVAGPGPEAGVTPDADAETRPGRRPGTAVEFTPGRWPGSAAGFAPHSAAGLAPHPTAGFTPDSTAGGAALYAPGPWQDTAAPFTAAVGRAREAGSTPDPAAAHGLTPDATPGRNGAGYGSGQRRRADGGPVPGSTGGSGPEDAAPLTPGQAHRANGAQAPGRPALGAARPDAGAGESSERSPAHARPADGPAETGPAETGPAETGPAETAPLPRRARGQTPAAARHGDPAGGPSAPFPDPSPEEAARAARARAAAGARFSAFREAAVGGAVTRPGSAGPPAAESAGGADTVTTDPTGGENGR